MLTTEFEDKKIIPQPGDKDTRWFTTIERIRARLPSLEGKGGKILKVAGDEERCIWATDTGGSAAFADITGQPSDNANLAAALNAKQDNLTFDDTPTAGSNNPVKSGGLHTALDGKVSDVKLNGTSIVAAHVANLETVDNLTSTTLAPLSANQGKVLNDRVNNLETIGRYLSLWDCATGLPESNPPTMPYTFKAGDYFIITIVDATTNYRPDGTTYTGAASTTVTTENVQKGDIWRFDGTIWMFEQNHSALDGVLDVIIGGASVVSAGVANLPNASASATGVLTLADWSTFNNKQDALTFDDAPTALSNNPVKSSGIKAAIDNKVRSGTTPPSGTANIGDIYVQYSA